MEDLYLTYILLWEESFFEIESSILINGEFTLARVIQKKRKQKVSLAKYEKAVIQGRVRK
jgi:hypothetical protein